MSCYFISPTAESEAQMTIPNKWQKPKLSQKVIEEKTKQHRQAVIEWAKKEFNNGSVILDTETTGLDENAQVIQIAILDSKTGNILFNKKIKPTIPVPPEATAVHHITNEELADAPNFGEVWDELKGILNGRSIIAYNAPFDRKLLNQTVQAYNSAVTKKFIEQPEKIEENKIKLGTLNTKWSCLMRAYSHYLLEDRWPKLTVACETEGIVVKDAHDACGDTLMTQALLEFLANKELE